MIASGDCVAPGEARPLLEHRSRRAHPCQERLPFEGWIQLWSGPVVDFLIFLEVEILDIVQVSNFREAESFFKVLLRGIVEAEEVSLEPVHVESNGGGGEDTVYFCP